MVSIDEYLALVGKSLGHSDWFVIDQARINQFAEVTEDRQFIHIDPARAKTESPFGGTIAHGFLT
ncbi:MAG: MaoC family dehydratase, partial [Alphaproteobacteria bacterium]|nr:MaoC family dehydratase [Alphaproteobacteria bacterium]